MKKDRAGKKCFWLVFFGFLLFFAVPCYSQGQASIEAKNSPDSKRAQSVAGENLVCPDLVFGFSEGDILRMKETGLDADSIVAIVVASYMAQAEVFSQVIDLERESKYLKCYKLAEKEASRQASIIILRARNMDKILSEEELE